ncbi:hypothetical protein IAR50_003062 [Cryptococcus sp. DSM 104548]
MVDLDTGDVIGHKYEIKEVLTHRDCYVSVYIATNIRTKEEIILKINHRVNIIMYEANLYQCKLRDLDGFPSLKWWYKKRERPYQYGAIALDRLGPSLDNVITEQMEGSKFSLKTTLQVMNQVITRIQALHERFVIHRGIKPDNFCIGLQGSEAENKVYMIDFDAAKIYLSLGWHIPYKKQNHVGNPNWASLAVDDRVEASRRDDMESAGFMAVYFLKGSLPWFSDSESSPYPDYCKKSETTLEYLCEDLPEELSTYISYCRSLKFDQEPDYDYCRSLFRQVFKREGFEDDGIYDWTTPKVEVDVKVETEIEENTSGDVNIAENETPKVMVDLKIEAGIQNCISRGVDTPLEKEPLTSGR